MAMSTQSAGALTRASRRLKQLGEDTLSIPDAQTIYDRKCDEIARAKEKLAQLVKCQIAIESSKQRSSGDTALIIAEKRAAEQLVERLSSEAGVLKRPIIAARPKPPLTPQQQVRADAVSFQPPGGKWQPGSAEEIAAARREVDALAKQCRDAYRDGNKAAETRLMPTYNAAKAKLLVLEGPPLSRQRAWGIPAEVVALELKKAGIA